VRLLPPPLWSHRKVRVLRFGGTARGANILDVGVDLFHRHGRNAGDANAIGAG